MLNSRFLNLSVVTLLVAAVGCVQSVDRASTQVRKAGDVKITISGSPVTTPADVPPAEPVAQPPAGTPMEPGTTAAEQQPTTETSQPAASAATTDGPAKFVGRVVVKGTPPSLPPLVKQGQPVKDAVCSKEEVRDESVLVSGNGGLANVFVYLRRPPRDGIPDAPAETPEVDQKGCVFLPHSQIVRVGRAVHLKNSDPVAHNVRIAGFSNAFNQTIPAGDEAGLMYEFRSPENLPAQVACDFHGWMSAWILPLNHPWGAVTDADGHFAIENLPDGDWEFVVWHERHGYINRAFKLTARHGQVVEQIFDADAAKLTP